MTIETDQPDDLAGRVQPKLAEPCCGTHRERTTSVKTRSGDDKTAGCCPGVDCGKTELPPRRLTIDFLYLDLEVCTRCQGTDSALDDALKEVAAVLEATGVAVVVNKVNVNSEDLAFRYRFLSSPTIRINGRDIQLAGMESRCDDCGDLCGETVDCRVWTYQGREYTEPPKAMILEAILREVYGPENGNEPAATMGYTLPDNLKRFYEAMRVSEQKD